MAALLAFVVVAFLGSPNRTNDGVPLGMVTRRAPAKVVAKMAGRLTGRVLGCFVCKGMTMEQVDRILGTDSLRLPSGGVIGPRLFWHLDYYTYGLTVSYNNDEGDVLRVNEVTFWPLTFWPLLD